MRAIARPVSNLAACIMSLLTALLVLAGAARPLQAFGPYSPGAIGYDVSYPECSKPLPATPLTFSIVGVSGGRAFNQNPCLVREYAWAQAAAVPVSLYMNLSFPTESTAFKAQAGPKGVCRSDDQGCQAFNYGFNTAQAAFADAQSQGTISLRWWLDIETTNTWSEDLALNVQVIQGAIDALQAHTVSVGVYSTAQQWAAITGSFRPGLPLWVAGAASASAAPEYCPQEHAFGGGVVWLVQYPAGDYDGDYACTAEVLTPPLVPPPARPSGLQATAISATAILVTWSNDPAAAGAVIADGSNQVLIEGAGVTSYLAAGLAPGSYHCYALTAYNRTGFSARTAWACVTTSEAGPG